MPCPDRLEAWRGEHDPRDGVATVTERRQAWTKTAGDSRGWVALPIVPAHKLPPAERRTTRTVSRPSLKITRHDDRKPPGDVSFEVWNPITVSYEPMASSQPWA